MQNKKSGKIIHSCNLCGSEDYSLLYNKGRHGKTVNNYVCNKCGFVFILPRPSMESLTNLYQGGQFSKTARGIAIPDDKKFYECEELALNRFNLLESQLGTDFWNKKKRSVLEVGCGTGSFLRLMQGAGWDVLGIEPDDIYAEAARQRYGIQINGLSLEDFNPNKCFDMICEFQVIEHVENPTIHLEKIYNLLDENGYLFIDCPGIEQMGGDINSFFWDVHINTFSQKTLTAFLVKTGFKIISIGYNMGFLYVLARKDKSGKEWQMESPKFIRSLVKQQELRPGTKPVNEFPTLIERGIKLLRTNPSKIPSKLIQKVFGHFYQNRKNADVIDGKLDAKKIAITPDNKKAKLRLVHIGIIENGNAGDTLLFPAVRYLFQKHVAPIDFTLLPLHSPVTKETIDLINQHDGLVIGGGGLFLSDSNPNNLSGWQWPCPPDLLDKINVPIIVFAVGYNRFRGQKDFAPIFTESLTSLIEKSSFFSLRNFGSISSIKKYLPPRLHDKIIFQPYPILSDRYPLENI